MLERGDRLEEHKSSSRRKYSTSVSKAVDTIHTRRTTTSVTVVVVVGAGEATKSFFTLQSLVSWRDVKHKKGEGRERRSNFCGVSFVEKSEYTSTLYYSS